jgi:hypothetical protein
MLMVLILIINRFLGDTKHGKYKWRNKEARPGKTGSGD